MQASGRLCFPTELVQKSTEMTSASCMKARKFIPTSPISRFTEHQARTANCKATSTSSRCLTQPAACSWRQ